MFERELRDASFVPRWTTVRSHRTQSVADHSFYVAIYSEQIAGHLSWPGDRHELLLWALWHDMPETATGDIPGPMKRRISEVAPDTLPTIDAETMGYRFPSAPVDWDDAHGVGGDQIVKLANKIDELAWLMTEKQLGNGSINQSVVENTIKSAAAIIDVWEATPSWAIPPGRLPALGRAIVKLLGDHALEYSKCVVDK